MLNFSRPSDLKKLEAWTANILRWSVLDQNKIDADFSNKIFVSNKAHFEIS